MKPERLKELPEWIDRVRELIYLMEEVQLHREPEISPEVAIDVRESLIYILKTLRREKRANSRNAEAPKFVRTRSE